MIQYGPVVKRIPIASRIQAGKRLEDCSQEKQKAGKAVRNVHCTALCAPVVFVKNSVKAKLQKPYSRLHTKLRLSSLKNKKVGKTAENVLCPVCVSTVLTLFQKNSVQCVQTGYDIP